MRVHDIYLPRAQNVSKGKVAVVCVYESVRAHVRACARVLPRATNVSKGRRLPGGGYLEEQAIAIDQVGGESGE